MENKNQKGFSRLLVVLIVGFTLVMSLAVYFLFVSNASQSPQPANNSQQNTQTTPTQSEATSTWTVVQNTDAGVSFKYPADFGSKYASFASSPAITATSDTQKINVNGCLIDTTANTPADSKVTINNVPFCLATSADPGAGQLYHSYAYTTLRNGNYITLQYVVHTPNGCSPYMGTPDFDPCSSFMNDYNNNVVKVIEESVATVQFTK